MRDPTDPRPDPGNYSRRGGATVWLPPQVTWTSWLAAALRQTKATFAYDVCIMWQFHKQFFISGSAAVACEESVLACFYSHFLAFLIDFKAAIRAAALPNIFRVS